MSRESERLFPKDYLEDVKRFSPDDPEGEPFYQKFYDLFLEVNDEVKLSNNSPQDKPNLYVQSRRYRDVFTVKQPAFEGYPAAAIPMSKSSSRINILAEGPFEDDLPKLLEGLKKQNASTLFAIGWPIVEGREKYFDYMHTEYSGRISCEEFISKTTSYPEKIPNEISITTNFQFFCYKHPSHGDFYILYIPNWPDHGLPEFNDADKTILGISAEHGHNACLHCSAGIGRSPTLLMAFMAYQRILLYKEHLTDEHLLRLFKEIIQEVKSIKPNAGNDGYQILSVLGLAEDIHECYRCLPQFSFVNNLRFTQFVPPAVIGATPVQAPSSSSEDTLKSTVNNGASC